MKNGHERYLGRVKIKKKIIMILSLPKTIYFNLRCFPLKLALKLPVLVSLNTKLKEIHRGMVFIDGKPHRFMVKIGFGGTDKIPPQRSMIFLEGGEVHFKGSAFLSRGTVLANAGYLEIGTNFFSNINCTIWCSNRMVMGADCLLGWNVMLRDTDGHEVKGAEGEERILIGDHCWLCSDAVLLKNASLGNNCILGYGSLLTKPIEGEDLMLAGRPAVVKREKIHWSR